MGAIYWHIRVTALMGYGNFRQTTKKIHLDKQKLIFSDILSSVLPSHPVQADLKYGLDSFFSKSEGSEHQGQKKLNENELNRHKQWFKC